MYDESDFRDEKKFTNWILNETLVIIINNNN